MLCDGALHCYSGSRGNRIASQKGFGMAVNVQASTATFALRRGGQARLMRLAGLGCVHSP
jgi:hypothetical protein